MPSLVAPEDQDSVLLVVGELAGNAAQHGRADMIVSLTFEGRAVCIEGLRRLGIRASLSPP
ncbi:ATP-binding protein [Streptomyces sparsogenes]|uniref:Putative regulatory protein n=1 Tax=Streptomyces sparsogenes DSM 40356 TaxID=1331668 RepID=A0A1R1S441_9ACTN|nr:ATP-binding protein [Streptomyces sparsogenes]OMI33060.1 putative regulatory protein [Streptomyces sparsogenes DSM 40356]